MPTDHNQQHCSHLEFTGLKKWYLIELGRRQCKNCGLTVAVNPNIIRIANIALLVIFAFCLFVEKYIGSSVYQLMIAAFIMVRIYLVNDAPLIVMSPSRNNQISMWSLFLLISLYISSLRLLSLFKPYL